MSRTKEVDAFFFILSALEQSWENLGGVAHNYHNCFPSQELFLLITIAIAEAPTTTLLAISVIGKSICGTSPNSLTSFLKIEISVPLTFQLS